MSVMQSPDHGSGRDPILFAAPQITAEDIEAVVSVLHSGWLTTASESAGLEADLAEYLGAAHVVAVSSCTAALEIALAHLRLAPGSRVGVPAWTFVSTALAAVHNDLHPVLLDVDPYTLNLSPVALAAAIEEGLDAVVPVHFGGLAVDQAIHDLCAAAGIPIVEDAAHALGSSDARGRIGGPGTAAACFSFYATKNLTSAEGGALATNDPELAAFARSYRSHGMSADSWSRYQPGGQVTYDLVEPGIKANLPDLLAALARTQLKRFDATQARRQAILNRYRQGLARSPLRFVPALEETNSADHLAVVLLPLGVDRSRVISGLKAANIHPSVHFRPLHQFSWFAEHASVGPGGLRVCDALAPRALSLPLHGNLTDDDVDRVCGELLNLLPT